MLPQPRKVSSLPDFRIFETEQFTKDLEGDFSGQRGRIQRKLAGFIYPQLRQNPFYGKNIKKLRGYHPDTWRYRLGDYRFFYTIDDKKKVVLMLTIDSRQDAY